MRIIYSSVTFLFLFCSVSVGYGQCKNYYNPGSGKATRYVQILEGSYEAMYLSTDGHEMSFAFISSLIVDPSFSIPAKTEIVFTTKKGSHSIFTDSEAKSTNEGYGFWAELKREDLPKTIGLSTISWRTSKGEKVINFNTLRSNEWTSAITCMY